MEFEVSAELVSIYLEDAREHLAVLDAALLGLERGGRGPETAASLLGPLHTLKGNSGMMGFASVKEYVHRLEEVLSRARDGRLALDGPAVDTLLAGAASLREAVEGACAAGAEVRDLAAEKTALADLLAARGAASPVALARAEAAEPASPTEPRPAPPGGAPGTAASSATTAAATARSSMVRVDFAKLDHLLNLVGELIVHRTKLADLGRRIAAVAPDAAPELLEAVHQVASVSTQLQETIMDVRMLPIRHVFERFPRLVRDLARQQGKQIELVVQGESTRVDKAIIDEVGEPLVHLIRNAVDHGIEPAEVRAARGKSPVGTILLSAAQESNQVVITLVDDGGGIDATEVKRRARERGILRPDEEISLVGDDPSMIGASGPDPTADNDACWHLASAVSYGACDSVAAWAQSCGAYATDRLNVYYGSYDANRGRSCPEQGLVIVGTRANGETLAHELGHLMLASADHADSRPANVMCASGCMQIRNDFAVGQAFRMSAHSRGVVNERGWRTGPTLDCDLPGNCPEVLLDVSR